MAQQLKGKVAIVTGASKGIGASIALHMAQAGAAVALNYASSKSGAERIVGEINGNGGQAIALQADMSKEADIRRLVTETVKQFGRLDILVNNAGIYQFAPLAEVTPEHFHKHFDLNVLGLLLAAREASAQFGAQGGSIINISSVVATKAVPNAVVYSATKAAVDSITRTLAAELGPRKIRVNSINPGMIDTEGTQSAGITESAMRKQVEMETPLGRIGRPQDVAPAAVFLASDDAGWITGETLYLAGGYR